MFNLVLALERNAIRTPNREAVAFGGNRISHQSLYRHIQSLAASFDSMGLDRGDVVAILLPNSSEFIEIAMASNAIGAIFLPLNMRLAYAEWKYILDHSGAKMLVVDPTHLRDGQLLRSELPELSYLIEVGGDNSSDAISFSGLRDEKFGQLFRPVEVGPDDVSRLMYTSGTTGRPKGVPLTYANVAWKNIDHMIEFGLTSSDRVLIVGPLYHVGGYDLPGVGCLNVGGSVVVLPKFDPIAVMSTIASERITGVWLPPSMVIALIQSSEISNFDTSSLRFMINGGEKMPEPLMKRLIEMFPSTWISDAFGMTETASGDTFLDKSHMLSKLGSVGMPVLHLEIRISREDGTIAEVNEMGDLLIRGPKVFNGYWKDDAATATAFRDGWFITGDIGHIDTDGYLYVDDRRKDMIISGGENIASAEIERVLYQHDSVLEAAVVARSDDRWGEVPCAFVVTKPGLSAAPEELIGMCRRQLAPFKVPREIVFVSELPRTSSGKILKRALRDRT